MTAHISDTVTTLTELVHDNVAAADRLRDAAEVADDSTNQIILEQMAEKREVNAEELQAHAAAFGRIPDTVPTLTDRLGRALTKIRGVISSNETEVSLEGAADSEKELRDEYQEAIANDAVASGVRKVLVRHVAETGDYPSLIRRIEVDERVNEATRSQPSE